MAWWTKQAQRRFAWRPRLALGLTAGLCISCGPTELGAPGVGLDAGLGAPEADAGQRGPVDSNGDPLPPGVVDESLVDENVDADGYCFAPEVGYFPCDDGAPPGTGRPGYDAGGGGAADDAGPGGQGMCDSQTFDVAGAEPPRLMLVVDKSGSMADAASGFAGTKWHGVRSTLTEVVGALDQEVAFGLMAYPAGESGAQVCAAGDVRVGVGLGNAASIVSRLSAINPGGGTPTATTLEAARFALASAVGNRAVVLATDGGPNCNAALDGRTCRCVSPQGCDDARNCLDDVASREAVRALSADGIATFVIGIPGSENYTDVLNSLAVAGGTAQTGARQYYDATSGAALTAAIEQIAVRLGQCRFDLGVSVDISAPVTVTVSGQPVARDSGRTSGWDLVDPHTVELFGAACTSAMQNGGAEVTIDYCPRIDG